MMASALNQKSGVVVSHETVRRTLKKMEYSKKSAIRGPNITPVHEIARVSWAKKHKIFNGERLYLQMNAQFGLMGVS